MHIHIYQSMKQILSRVNLLRKKVQMGWIKFFLSHPSPASPAFSPRSLHTPTAWSLPSFFCLFFPLIYLFTLYHDNCPISSRYNPSRTSATYVWVFKSRRCIHFGWWFIFWELPRVTWSCWSNYGVPSHSRSLTPSANSSIRHPTNSITARLRTSHDSRELWIFTWHPAPSALGLEMSPATALPELFTWCWELKGKKLASQIQAYI